jgi:hypothetical protein
MLKFSPKKIFEEKISMKDKKKSFGILKNK